LRVATLSVGVAVVALALALAPGSEGIQSGKGGVAAGPNATTEGLDWTTEAIVDEDLVLSHPPGWRRSAAKLMPRLADPREVAALGTFDLRPGRRSCAHLPGNAIEQLKPTDGLIVIVERSRRDDGETSADYPRRPVHFSPDDGYASEAADCLDQPKAFFDRLIPFWDSGRRFYAYIALGEEASRTIREEAWAILDRLEIGTGGRC
jgi:hypothetical protein